MCAELAPLPLERLLAWIRDERAARGTVFGLHQDLFRSDLAGRPYALARRGRRLESPVGVAAGPHSQLAQNLVAAWLCGARYLELKTVQERDRLDVPRPCIDMADEGYNCEWSQELPLEASAAQYLDAWTAISVLRHEAMAAAPNQTVAATAAATGADPGFAMDLSVGYDLAGIRSGKMQRCLDRLAAPNDELVRRLRAARAVYPGADEIAPADRLCDSVTLSTMHGCPPEEIERIARFLLAERGLHTTIKLNPTLLGARAVRELLGETLGYDIEIPDHAFDADLAWDAALDLIRSLRDEAARLGLGFGVKLTNTLACRNTRGVLPASEAMVYLSGRALHPVAVRLAAALQDAFAGELDISFAGGAAAHNVAQIAACGLTPVTVCSDLLRPGGYQRLHQYLDELQSALDSAGARDLDTYILQCAGVTDPTHVGAAALANLKAYAAEVAADPAYRKATYPDRSVKTRRALGRFDCIGAPCQDTCPAGQDVPAYMAHTARGELTAALGIVLRDNPFPTVTGMVCDHPCQPRCTRVNYEAPVRIRDVKRTLAHTAPPPAPPAPVPAAPTGHRVAVVGAGPAGLACAWYLNLAGVRATVYEAKDGAGGMMAGAIPVFRLTDRDIQCDLRRITATGIEIRTGEMIDRARLQELLQEYDLVFAGIGAQADRELGVSGTELPGVWPALRFLSAVRRGRPPAVGRTVAVIGGGNTAMDAARTALRLVAPGGVVHLLYRRTLAEMPAAREEIQAIRAEGVLIRELVEPKTIEPLRGGKLMVVSQRMRLGALDASGRRRPEPIPGVTETLMVDAVIPAVGQRLAGDLLTLRDLPPNDPDDATPVLQTGIARVLTGGDALRRAGTLIEAIADGRRAAEQMLAALGLPSASDVDAAGTSAGARAAAVVPPWRERPLPEWQDRAARLQPPVLPLVRAMTGPGDLDLVIGELTAEQARAEAARCLDCATRCDVCVSVCPNRANLAYDVRPVRWPLVKIVASAAGGDSAIALVPDGEFAVVQTHQTANLVDFCNECGNCATFCPTGGAPYRDKPRLALSRDVFARRDGVHRLTRRGAAITIEQRRGEPADARPGEPPSHSRDHRLTRRGDCFVYETAIACVELDAATFAVRRVESLANGPWTLDLRGAARLAVLLDGLADHPLAGGLAEVT
ncbi:MAG: FAD-dependent oxidoreductase [Candidatus Krumholzibacteria bacterium]|jgi:putative selenate reductase|nr:FAD-dependent oxidoreductase [Candidatus Krumholzibacteria bacterium]